METKAPLQEQQEPRRLEEDWAETEWFLEWLRLARREYQGNLPAASELRKAA